MGSNHSNYSKILFLMDLTRKLRSGEDLQTLMREEEWVAEGQMIRTLRQLGFDVKPFAIHDEIETLIEEIKETEPTLIFNQCEAFRDDRMHESHVVALLELLKVKYTGAGPSALALCKDKGRTKEILSYHGIRVPQFILSPLSKPLSQLPQNFSYPCIVKPLDREASEGISQQSVCDSEEQALKRIDFLHRNFKSDAIVEEYIEGREIYVGVIGSQKPQAFPPRELFFGKSPKSSIKVATYKSKWDDSYRKRWGIKSGSAKALPLKLQKKIAATAVDIYKLLQIDAYARIDFRLQPSGDLVFLEANPNPSLARGEDFAAAAEKAGLSYSELITEIVGCALSR